MQAESPAELPGKHPASGYFSIRRGCCWDSVGSPRQSTWRSEQEGEGQGPHHQRPARVFEAPGEEPSYRTLNIGAQSALIPPSLLWGPGQSSAWEQDTEALVSTPHRLWACARDSVCLRAWISRAGCCGVWVSLARPADGRGRGGGRGLRWAGPLLGGRGYGAWPPLGGVVVAGGASGGRCIRLAPPPRLPRRLAVRVDSARLPVTGQAQRVRLLCPVPAGLPPWVPRPPLPGHDRVPGPPS